MKGVPNEKGRQKSKDFPAPDRLPDAPVVGSGRRRDQRCPLQRSDDLPVSEAAREKGVTIGAIIEGMRH